MRRQGGATQNSNVAHTMFEAYQQYFTAETSSIGSKIPFQVTVFSPDQLISLCKQVEDICNSQPNVIELSSPCIVIGDLHGHILDLFRIIKENGFPRNKKYVFLGDLVDRGQFSLETVLMVFCFKLLWKDNVVIIRGNHEFDYTCNNSGFLAEIQNYYKDFEEIYQSFLKAFSVLPIGCVIDGKRLCVHGGIGPHFTNVSQLESIHRPIFDFGDEVLDECLWSDPNVQIAEYEKSPRGTGVLYGINAVNRFLSENHLQTIIRGHENTLKGCENLFDGKVYTVFSASNYCGAGSNDAGILSINGDTITPIFLPPLPYLLKKNAIVKKQ